MSEKRGGSKEIIIMIMIRISCKNSQGKMTP